MNFQALGDASSSSSTDKGDGQLTSHARHLVTIAQEKAELLDQGSIL
jgi:hypothetical protein